MTPTTYADSRFAVAVVAIVPGGVQKPHGVAVP